MQTYDALNAVEELYERKEACGLLPETCCEKRNVLLDRGLVIGTYDNKEIGFWRDIL